MLAFITVDRTVFRDKLLKSSRLLEAKHGPYPSPEVFHSINGENCDKSRAAAKSLLAP